MSFILAQSPCNVFECVVSVGPQIEVPPDPEKHIQEGNSASIMCSLKEGDPPVLFEWMKDSDLATSLLGVEVVTHKLSSMLTILAASDFHNGNYYCKASNPVSWSVMQTKVLVDGTLNHLTVH